MNIKNTHIYLLSSVSLTSWICVYMQVMYAILIDKLVDTYIKKLGMPISKYIT